MAFVFEQIRRGDLVETTAQYLEASKYVIGGWYDQRVVDYEQEATLYCISINGEEERPPGKHLFFYQGYLTQVYTYRRGPFGKDYEDSYDQYKVYSVHAQDIPNENKQDFFDALTLALQVEGHGWAALVGSPVKEIKVIYMYEQTFKPLHVQAPGA